MDKLVIRRARAARRWNEGVDAWVQTMAELADRAVERWWWLICLVGLVYVVVGVMD